MGKTPLFFRQKRPETFEHMSLGEAFCLPVFGRSSLGTSARFVLGNVLVLLVQMTRNHGLRVCASVAAFQGPSEFFDL